VMQEEASISNADRPGRMMDVDGSAVDIFPLPVEEAALEALLRDLFENHWQEIVFGPIIPRRSIEKGTGGSLLLSQIIHERLHGRGA
jgi:hypothetical protein